MTTSAKLNFRSCQPKDILTNRTVNLLQDRALFDRGVHIVTGIRTNMKNRLMDVHDKIMLRKRSIIETINDMLKNVAQIVHTRHRSISNFIVNLLAGIAAYAFYDTKPSINMEFEIDVKQGVKQLTLF